ncbi:MAG: hypothetical protein EBX40_00590 [Gammaproteobacteria bacterium]|nr:hypothetical protein [Gammaproteobacteria bacterium]
MKEVKLVKMYDSELIKKGYKSTRIVQDGLTGKPPVIDDECYYGSEDQVEYLKGRGYEAKTEESEEE